MQKGMKSGQKVRVYGCFENLFLETGSKNDFRPFDLGGGFTIRRIRGSDVRFLYALEGRRPREGPPLEMIDSLSCVVETSVEVDNSNPLVWLQKEVQTAGNRLRTIATVLLICFDGIFKLRVFPPHVGDLVDDGGVTNYGGGEVSWKHGLFMSKYGQDGVQLGEKELQEFKVFLQKFESLEKPNFVYNGLRRFVSASEMAGELQELDYRFVDYIRSLEAFLGESDEAAQKLSLRTAMLLGGTPAERQDAYDFIKGAYNWRSGTVHGGSPRHWKGRLKWIQEIEAVDMLHWYCRWTAKRIIDLLLEIDKNAETADKWRAKGDEKKAWIAGMLDTCLVRKDLDKALNAFYAGSADVGSLYSQYEATLKAPFGSRNQVVNVMAPPDPNTTNADLAKTNEI